MKLIPPGSEKVSQLIESLGSVPVAHAGALRSHGLARGVVLRRLLAHLGEVEETFPCVAGVESVS